MDNHLTDDEIQQFVLNNNPNDTAIEHITTCEACRVSAANYATMFKAIEEAPAPLFEFDLANMVMVALPKPKQLPAQRDYFMYSVLFAAIAVLCIPVYLYKKDLARVFENLAPVMVVLIVLPVTAILCLQLYETYKVYKKQAAAIE